MPTELHEIGIDIGIDKGTYDNTEFKDGKIVLSFQENSDDLYNVEGYWESDVINLRDKFTEYNNVVLSKETVPHAKTGIQTRTSDDGIVWNDYIHTLETGKIQSPKKQYIQIKLLLIAGTEDLDIPLYENKTEEIDSLKQLENHDYFKVENDKLKISSSYGLLLEEDSNYQGEGFVYSKELDFEDFNKDSNGDYLIESLNINSLFGVGGTIFKIESTKSSAYKGIAKILFYNKNNEVININRNNIIEHNADVRNSDSEIVSVFVENSPVPPPYRSGNNSLYYTVKLNSIPVKIRTQDWGNTDFSSLGIKVTILGSGYSESKNFSPIGKSAWVEFDNFQMKQIIIIKKDSHYGYYTDSFQSLGTTYPTKEQFEQYGMKDLSMLEASDIPIEYEMELISEAEDEKCFSYSFDLNGQHKNMKSIDDITVE